jgi:hypothetical protein
LVTGGDTWVAETYPSCRVLAVSNSKPQGEFTGFEGGLTSPEKCLHFMIFALIYISHAYLKLHRTGERALHLETL